MDDGLLRRSSNHALVLSDLHPETEWDLCEALASRLEREGLSRNATALAEALLLQSPLRRCFIGPMRDEGPNAAFVTVRCAYVSRMVVAVATFRDGWGRIHLGHTLHLLLLLAGPTLVSDEEFGVLRRKLCMSLTEIPERRRLLACSTPEAILAALTSGDAISPREGG